MSSITFVTAWLNLFNGKYYNHRTDDWYLSQFKDILNTGVNICIYVSKEYYEKIHELEEKYENLKIMKTLDLEDTLFYKISKKYQLSMPAICYSTKDTYEFISLMNSKIEFVKDAIDQNPWGSTHFSWIDFGIGHLLKIDRQKTLDFLGTFRNFEYKTPFFAFPGCADKFDLDYMYYLKEQPFWRFCGSFFIGDKQSILNFYRIFFENLDNFFETHRTIVWEINYWAWLESTGKWTMNWYQGYHDHTIFNIPQEHYTIQREPTVPRSPLP